MWFFLLLGAIAFLIMEHAIVFWLVFVPLALLFVLYVGKWFKTGGMGLSNFAMAGVILIMMVVALLIVCIP